MRWTHKGPTPALMGEKSCIFISLEFYVRDITVKIESWVYKMLHAKHCSSTVISRILNLLNVRVDAHGHTVWQWYGVRGPVSIFHYLNCISRDENSTFKRGLGMSYWILVCLRFGEWNIRRLDWTQMTEVENFCILVWLLYITLNENHAITLKLSVRWARFPLGEFFRAARSENKNSPRTSRNRSYFFLFVRTN